MEKRRRRRYVEEDVQLEDVLQPYEEAPAEPEDYWQEEAYDEEPQYDEMYLDQSYVEEYSEEHEAADLEGRVQIAMGVLDLISILIGIVVILVLVAMFVALFGWLQTDILNSALLMQGGLK